MPASRKLGLIEKSIEGLYPLQISDRDPILMPKDWTLEKLAIAKMNEGIKSRNSIEGDRNRNIEKSIEYYRCALGILASDDPARAIMIRARILINLGNAYQDPIRGNRPDDIKLAICAYHLALAVFSKDKDPTDWANAQMNLGAAYGEYSIGDRQDNIEKSIEASQKSLEILSYENNPVNWAIALMNLGTAYTDRNKGDIFSNILMAIKCLRQTWKVWKRKEHPDMWAIVMMNLGNAHLSRNFDNKSSGVEAAIKSYNQALKKLDKNNSPYDWSLVKLNLGNAYLDRIKGDPKANTDSAIHAYLDALKVRTKENMPLDWAITIENLGNAYLKAGRIKDAIYALNSALDIITYERMPLEWAKIKVALGRAHSRSTEGAKEENIKISIKEYQKALKVFRPDTFPRFCRDTARELGDIYFDKQRWGKSAEIYKVAVQADERLFQDSLLSISKEIELIGTGNLYRRAGYSLAKSAQFNDAAIFLERGRARILGESVKRDRVDLENVRSKKPRLYNEYIEASILMRNLDSKSTTPKIGPITENIWMQAEKTHAQLNEIIEAIRHINGYENFLKEANWVDLLEAICDEKPLVYLVATSHGGLALIIYHPNNSDEVRNVIAQPVWLEEFSDLFLYGLLNKYSELKEPMGFYVSYHRYWIEESIDIEDWLDSLTWVTGELWQKIMGPLIIFLRSIQAEEAFLIPFGLLALLPLHAAWSEVEGEKKYALDFVTFSYVPSTRFMSIAKSIIRDTDVNSFLAIYSKILEKSEEEVESITEYFKGTSVSLSIRKDITRNEAIEELSKAQIVHFSCHGDAVLDNPMESSLSIADGEDLTLEDISELNLTNARLASLSACKTGIIGARLPDEVVSLPTAFMRAGFAGVVAPLWDVMEEDAARVMEHFYNLWIKKGLNPAQALRAAQIFIRDNREYRDYFDWAAFYFTGL